jgi:CHAT domain-containing protein
MSHPGHGERRDRVLARVATHLAAAGALAAVLLAVAVVPAASGAAQNTAHDPVGERESEGDRLLSRGDAASAIERWSDALEGAEGAASAGRLRAKRAEALMSLGRYERTVDDLEGAIAAAREDGDAALEARLQGSLGTALLLSGKPGSAEAFGACISFARRAGDPLLEARGVNNLGVLYEGLGETERALQHFDRGLRIAEAAGDVELAAAAQLNGARVRLAGGDVDGARAAIEGAVSDYERLEDSARKARGLGAAGALWLDEPKTGVTVPERIVHALDEAERIAGVHGDARGLSVALGYQARALERAGLTEAALERSGEARRLAGVAGAPDLAYRWEWQMGRVHLARGEPLLAVQSYREARATLLGLRRELIGARGPVRDRFDEDVAAIHLELTDLLLRQAASDVTAETRQALLAEVRETMELRKAIELESYYRDDCVAALEATAQSVDDLSENAAALYPVFLRDRLTLLLSTGARIHRVDVDAPREALEATIEEFRERVENQRTRRYLRPASRLYEWLIRPLELILDEAGVDTLVVVPDGPLRTVPLAALYDARTDEHLIQKRALVIAPGIRLLDPRPLRRADAQFLIAGLSEGVQGFDPLPHVEGELDRINALYGGRVYRGAEFRTAAVEAALDARAFTVVHFATHAEFGADSRSSFLLTYDGRMDLDSLERVVKYGRFRTDPVELLTLSACETAAGDERAALGLAGLAIKAGARSALATLWQVDDEAAAILMSRFYEKLKDPRISKAEALRRAQRAFIEDEAFRDRYKYPLYWAPYTLIGNWL